MRFLISLLAFRPGRIGGTETYLRELVAAMPAVLGGDEASVLLPSAIARDVPTPGLGRILVDASLPRLLAERMAEALTPYRSRAVERAVEDFAPDAILFPQISIFPRRVSAPSVVTVGDMQHLVHPENFAFVDRWFRAAIYPYSLQRAALVISMSDYTRRELIEHAGVPAGKIRVVHLGARTPAAAVSAPPVAPPYLYFPAATNPHKGHDVLLASLAAAARDHGLEHRLVLTGQRTAHWRSLERRITELGLHERVVHLGFVARETVDALYRHADAVVFPTRFEGFGLPVVEAAAAGARVIASRLAVFEELGVVGVERIDFEDPAQLAAAVRSASPASLGANASSWERNARETLEALREAAMTRKAGGG